MVEQPPAPNPLMQPKPSHAPGSAWRDPRYRNPWLTNPYAEGRSRAIVFGAAVLGVVGVGVPVLDQFVDVTSDVASNPRSLIGASGSSNDPAAPTPPAPVAASAVSPGLPVVAAVDRAVRNASLETVTPIWATGMPVQTAVAFQPAPAVAPTPRSENPPLAPVAPAVDESTTPPVGGGTPPVDEDPTPPVVEDPAPPVVEEPTPPVVEEPTPPVDEDRTPPVDAEPIPAEAQAEFAEEFSEVPDEAPAMSQLDEAVFSGG